jgi:hypothetical protein
MPSPLSVKRNNFLENPKRSDIYTPPWLSRQIFNIVRGGMPDFRRELVFDPAIGGGSLTQPFRDAGARVVGGDVNPQSSEHADLFFYGPFESLTRDAWGDGMLAHYQSMGVRSADWLARPTLVVCNPPFNAASGRKLYPEVFLRHIDEVFDSLTPTVMIAPMGMRLNQRTKSARWRYMRDNWEITSILALPIDAFPGVLFHCEVLFFNVPGIKPHYFADCDGAAEDA